MNRHYPEIDPETGIWTNRLNPSSPMHNSIEVHKVDPGLTKALVYMLEHQKSVVDFGCGNADYAMALAKVYPMMEVKAYDGNPNTPEMTGGFAGILDLSKPFDLGRKFDCVISLEVAEHIPASKESVYIDNLTRHCDGSLVMSWARPKQGGDGHVNERDETYVGQVMADRGYYRNETATRYLRQEAELWWFKDTLMVFQNG